MKNTLLFFQKPKDQNLGMLCNPSTTSEGDWAGGRDHKFLYDDVLVKKIGRGNGSPINADIELSVKRLQR